jgi:PAS domain S-box-containing protein
VGRIRKPGGRLSLDWQGYVVAIGLVALATWLKYLAQPTIIPADVPILYMLAVVPTAIFFGFGPSILVCILSLWAYDFFFVPPLHQFIGLSDIQDAPILVIFLLVGVLFSYLASNLRQKNEEAVKEIAARKQSEAELAKYREHLEDLVKQRTTQLGKANLILEDEISERKKAEEALQKAHNELEMRIEERTAELLQVNARLKEENEERVLAEQYLRLEEARLDALLRLNRMSEASVDDIAGFILDRGIALTESKIGFVGFLSEDESVYTLHAVSKDVVKECAVEGNPLQWHIAGAGIWADAIRERKTLFANDYNKPYPSKKGVPLGHPPVNRLMVVPLFDGKRIVAVAGMGNKGSDYNNSDERQIALLLQGMWSHVQRKRSSEALKEAYDNLEQRVQQRTADLAASNAKLNEQITERKKAEEELLRVNRALRAISECNKAMVRATDEQMLLTDVCRIICDSAGYRMAWVGTAEHDDAKSVRPVAWGGAEDGYLAKAAITWADTEHGCGPTGLAVRTGKTYFFQDIATEPAAAPWRDAAIARGYRSSIAIPLSDTAGNVLGVFSLYAGQPNGFTPAEVELLEELARDLAFGISVLRERVKRKQAEERLRETGDYLNNLLNYANAPIIVWDPQYHITRFNHAFERLTGRTSDEVIGKELDILFPDNGRVESLGHIARASSGERWEVVEIPVLHKDGSVRTVLWNSATLYGQDGKTPVATIAQGEDITERKRMEESLQLERDRLISILNSMEDAVAIMSPHYTVEYINPSMQSKYGAVSGRKCYQYFSGRDDVCPWCNNKEVISGGKTLKREAEPNRRGIIYEITDAPLKNADGSISKLSIFHDITEHKKVEQLKDEFISMVSHELKTPITVIIGAIYTALSEGISVEEAQQLLEDAASSAESLARIVDNLLELSRAQANRLMIRKEPVDMSETARKVAKALTKMSAMHHLVVDIPAGLPRVQADRVRVERILHNLVENAIKYSPDGGTITVFARQKDNHLVVGVKDEGIGISAEDQARLFKPFERLDTTSGVAGVGLGLDVCRRLVEAHGGSIWAESEPGKGTTFFFTLPV